MSEKLSGVLKNSRRGSKTLCAAAVEAAAGPMSRPETPTSGGGPSPTFLNATNNSSPTQQQQQQPSKAVVEPPTTATSNTLAGQMARKKAKQSDANAEALTVPQSHRGPYEIRPYELTFYDAEVEARYCEFQFVENYFIGAIATFVLVVVCYVLLLVDAADDFGDAASVLSLLGIVATFALIGAFYKLQTHRESIALATVCVVSVVAMFHFFQGHPEEQRTVSYLCVTAVAVLLPQVRIHRLVVVFAPLSVLASVVILFAVPGYDPHPTSSHAEDILWLQGFIGWFVLLFFLERKQRMSFCQVDTNRNELKAIENHIEVMQDILATFFPRTPTRDLLAQRVEATSKSYPGTALIVTDISGFTAWSTRTEPRVVIDVLAQMMTGLEEASPEYNVERVYTVGDSFVGAVFIEDNEVTKWRTGPNNDGWDRPAVGRRCVQAVQFGAIAIAELKKMGFALRMRVGIHVGDILGGFIGRSPPVFDLFGDAYQHAKHIEGTGVPNCVHISREALDVASIWGTPVEPEETEQGVVCTGWIGTEAFNAIKSAESVSRTAAAETPEPNLSDNSSAMLNTSGAAATKSPASDEELVPVGNSKKPGAGTQDQAKAGEDKVSSETTRAVVNRLIEMSDLDAKKPAVKRKRSKKNLSNSKTTADNEGEEENEENAEGGANEAADNKKNTGDDDAMNAALAMLWFSPFLLRFANSRIESEYLNIMRSSRFHKDVQFYVVMALALTLIALTNKLCLSNDTDLAIYSVSVASCIAMSVSLVWGTHHFWTSAYFVFFVVTAPSLMTTFATTQCTDGENNGQQAVRVLFLFTHLIYFFAPQFCLATPYIHRAVIWVLQIGLMIFAARFLRPALTDEDPFDLDLLFYIGPIVFILIPFFAERTFRTAFAAHMQLKIALNSTGRYATYTRRALDVMLPRFIAEKVFESFSAAQEASSAAATSAAGKAGENVHQEEGGALTKPSDAASDSSLDDMVWEYPLVCAMFVCFHLTEDTYDRVRPILDDMESIATAHGVIKVKTISTYMLCVAGIEDSSAHGVMESTRAMCHTAIRMIRGVFHKIDDCTFAIGVHCGPCVGAVLAVNGLTFDVFGDTINTASRMQSTA
eukprot:PhM_4_TR18848/c1_g1_i7/m.70523